MPRLLAILATLLVATPALAATYEATPATPPADARLIVKSVAWSQAGATYRGTSDESRPAVICQGLAKRTGPLTRFTVDGRAFGPADLDRCNAAAAAPTALARAN